MAAIDNLIDEIERSYEELNAQLADPEVLGDRSRYAGIARKHAELQQVYELARRFREAEQTVADAEGLLGDDSSDAEMREFAQEELRRGPPRALDELSEEIRVRMLTRDPNDAKDVIIEIRAGTGGNEASLFAGDLARMYTRYAQAKGFEVEILSANENDDGGYKEITLEVKGQGAFSALKYESGVHRVQRVPVTEAAGRIHTSTATVAVLPEAEDIEIEIHPERPARRHLPRPRARRAERQHHRLGGPAHARAHRRDRELPGREEPAAEQGARPAHPEGAPLRRSSRRSRTRSAARRGAPWSAAATARRRSAPTTSSRTASATTASGSPAIASPR